MTTRITIIPAAARSAGPVQVGEHLRVSLDPVAQGTADARPDTVLAARFRYDAC